MNEFDLGERDIAVQAVQQGYLVVAALGVLLSATLVST